MAKHKFRLILSRVAISAWLWKVTLGCLITYGIWQLVALFYGWMPFAWSKGVLAIGAACALPQVFLARHGTRVTLRGLVTVLLVSSIIVSVVLQVLFFPNIVDAEGRASHDYLLGVVVSNIAWLMVGYALQVKSVARRSNVLATVLLCGVAIPVFGALDGGVVIQYWLFRDDVAGANHLTVAAAAYLLLIMAYALAVRWWRICIFVVALLVLFVLGGRSELALLMVSVVVYEWMRGVRRSMFVPIVLVLIFGAVTAGVLMGSALDLPGVSQMLFSGGLTEDSSYSARQFLLTTGLALLPGQALVGDVSGMIRLHGGLGSYIHNLLSAWQFYGVFVFCLIVALLASNVRRVQAFVHGSADIMTTFSAICFISVCVGVIIAKSVTYQGLWLVLGLYAGRSSYSFRTSGIASGTGQASLGASLQ